RGFLAPAGVGKEEGPLADARLVHRAGGEQREEPEGMQGTAQGVGESNRYGRAAAAPGRSLPIARQAEYGLAMKANELSSAGVVGAGQMGAGIAQVLCQKGLSVLLAD